MAVFLILLISGLTTVMLFENKVLQPGDMDSNTDTGFVVMTIMEVLTLCAIPSSLYMFRWKWVRASLKAGREKALLKWGIVRMCMLGLLLIANTWLYYAFALTVTFAYLSIILLICMTFVMPTMGRCIREVEES